MIRHALARVLHAVANRVDPEPTVVYLPSATTWKTTPYPYQVWCGSKGPNSTSTTY